MPNYKTPKLAHISQGWFFPKHEMISNIRRRNRALLSNTQPRVVFINILLCLCASAYAYGYARVKSSLYSIVFHPARDLIPVYFCSDFHCYS